jgi:uncharacterized protein YciI
VPPVTAGLRRWLGLDRLEQTVAEQQEHLDQLAVAHHETRLLAEGDAAPAGSLESRYRAEAIRIERRHDAQTPEQIKELRERYADPVYGEVSVWSMVEKLAQCIDPSDCRLFGVSQQVHVLQMIEAMDADGVLTDELLLVALIHDLGKVLLLTDEDPANVVAMNRPVGEHEDGIGLDRATLQWNHDELAWSRLHDLVPDHIGWLIRYHSIDLDSCAALMDDRDRDYHERYLRPFSHYDHDLKSPFALPSTTIAVYRDVIEDAFPQPIRF